MNRIEQQYLSLLHDILENGKQKTDRTGTGTISVFGRQLRHDFRDGFPLLTTKRMAFKAIVTELLWFLRGETNIKYLVDNGCHIWDGDAYKNYFNSFKWYESEAGKMAECPTKEDFINKIKTDDSFAKEWGDLGPIYGKQWRNWQNEIVNYGGQKYNTQSIDQIQQLINDLKQNPDSRRLMVNAWNVGQLHDMVLPPCHYGFQLYTSELTIQEKRYLVTQYIMDNNPEIKPVNGFWEHDSIVETAIDDYNLPKRKISLMWNQRSVDTFLGLPFNIASYGLLLMIIAKEVNMIPDELIGNLGDCHLYSNHVEQAKEQLNRNPHPLPTLVFSDKIDTIFKKYRGEKINDLGLDYGYYNELNNVINSMGIDDFILEGYQSHPTIKAPLSN